MGKQNFPILEFRGNGDSEEKVNSKLGAFGESSLNVAIDFSNIEDTLSFNKEARNYLLLSDISLPTMKVGAKDKSYIGANELT